MKNKRGFTLAELLIVVAITAVLVAVSIPIFTSQLEKSREATDLANVRAAYAEIMAEAIEKENPKPITVNLKQKQMNWQSSLPITIGGITYDGTNTDNWSGIPTSNGTCKVSYDKDKGIHFRWSGATGNLDSTKNTLKQISTSSNKNNSQAYYSNQTFYINGKKIKARIYYADSSVFKNALKDWTPRPSKYEDSPFYKVQYPYNATETKDGFAYYTCGADGSIDNFIYVNETGVYQTKDEGKTWYDITPDDE